MNGAQISYTTCPGCGDDFPLEEAERRDYCSFDCYLEDEGRRWAEAEQMQSLAREYS